MSHSWLQLIRTNLISDETSKSYVWLSEMVLLQIVKWAGDSLNTQNHSNPDSLTLVSNEQYYDKYNALKSKYGKEMVKVCTSLHVHTK